MKELFRHFSTWILFIGIAVSFFAFLNATSIYQNVQLAIDETNEYKYKYMYNISVLDISDEIDIVKVIKELPGNVISTGNYIYVDATDRYQECEVIIKQDEKLAYPVEIISESGEVYVGKKLLDESFLQNEKRYITLNGKPVLIAGIVASEKTEVLNYKIVFMKDSNIANTILNSESIYLECGSNRMDYHNQISEFYNSWCDTLHIDYQSVTEKYIEVGSENADEKFYNIISFFAIINCVVISEFWILRRKKEMIIRKLFGFTTLKLFLLIYKQIICISSAAVISVLLVENTLSLLIPTYLKLSMQRVGIAIIFIFCSSQIITLFPIYKVTKFKLGDGREMI